MQRIAVTENQVVSDQPAPEVSAALLSDCVRACIECELACIVCADASLADERVVDMRRSIRIATDCADICALTARMLVRFVHSDSSLLRVQLAAAARACVTCEAECRAHDLEHCQMSADACLACYESCRDILHIMAPLN